MTAEGLVRIDGAVKRFGAVTALDRVSVAVAPGRVTGLVGPDAAGKTTLIRLIAGLLLPDAGRITVLGLDSVRDADAIHAQVGYMPQRFGLYEDLTVAENLNLYADLRGVVGDERTAAFERLLHFTGLGSFQARLAGALSGGMKQKLGLACALVRPPRLLLLDEPSVGVDPVSRRELWRMVYDLVGQGIGVLWSTAYLDEAERCQSVLLLDRGRLLYDGPPRDFTDRVHGRTYAIHGVGAAKRAVQTRAETFPGVVDSLIQGRAVRLVMTEGARPPTAADLRAPDGAQVAPVSPRFEDAFVAALRGEEGAEHASPPPLPAPKRVGADVPMVEASDLSRVFGTFRAVDRVSFQVRPGEIFGLLGPNGAGKSTTFKMMCGLLPPSSGVARVAGIDLRAAPAKARTQLGYMSQKFSLYPDLSARQNLEFFGGAYGLSGRRLRDAIDRMVATFDLAPHLGTDAGVLPLGFKQRLALASAILHEPPILFLDEPTSGVDPLTRREFWDRINAMAGAGVTVLVTTHFLDEAEYCDRIGIVYRGRLIAEGAPDDLK
ncbi:MAG TPA: ATP-binding cassette domain-containing protein, partial [Azospirillaceae bacterium]|nr:ATP-binding cassette domain-containing protein [Azospirillaceae bacterium]